MINIINLFCSQDAISDVRDRAITRNESNMLNSVDKMPSPRILKSHLPFYLLHPELLDTAKVNLTFHLL
jgi:hypothetical protein